MWFRFKKIDPSQRFGLFSAGGQLEEVPAQSQQEAEKSTPLSVLACLWPSAGCGVWRPGTGWVPASSPPWLAGWPPGGAELAALDTCSKLPLCQKVPKHLMFSTFFFGE